MGPIDGETMRLARERAGKTQQEMADSIGVSLRTVGNWERSGVVPRKYWPRLQDVLPGALVARTDRARGAEASEVLDSALGEANALLAQKGLGSPAPLSGSDIREWLARSERVREELAEYSAADLIQALQSRLTDLERENYRLQTLSASLEMSLDTMVEKWAAERSRRAPGHTDGVEQDDASALDPQGKD